MTVCTLLEINNKKKIFSLNNESKFCRKKGFAFFFLKTIIYYFTKHLSIFGGNVKKI